MKSNCNCLALLVPTVVLAILSACVGPLPTTAPDLQTTPPMLSGTPPANSVTLEPTSAMSENAPDWPMFRFGLDRAGYNANETRLKPPLAVTWEYKTGSKI